MKEQIVPIKYYLVYGGFIFFIYLLLLKISSERKRKKNKIKKILCSLMAISILLVNSMVYYYQDKTRILIDKLSNSEYEYIEYSYIVLKDASDKIEDYQDTKSGLVLYSVTLDNLVKEEASNLKLQIADYPDLNNAFSDLINKKIKGILLESNEVEILSETDEKFYNKVKVIWTKKYKISSKDISKKVDIGNEAMIILLSGLDTYGEITNVSRSDVNILMIINPKTSEILLIHIPRDYYIPVYGTTEKDKLTHTGVYGIENTVKTIENYFEIDINYYIKVNFNTLIDLIDILGGVTINNDVAFNSGGIYFQKGTVKLNGQKALVFTRTRKVLDGGDRARGRNQEKVIEAIIKKSTTPKILGNYASLLNILGNSFATNMTTTEIKKFVNFELDNLPNWKITSTSVDGDEVNPYGTPFFPNSPVYMMEPNIETVKAAQEAIKKTMEGK